jgi:hypothetical protein
MACWIEANAIALILLFNAALGLYKSNGPKRRWRA